MEACVRRNLGNVQADFVESGTLFIENASPWLRFPSGTHSDTYLLSLFRQISEKGLFQVFSSFFFWFQYGMFIIISFISLNTVAPSVQKEMKNNVNKVNEMENEILLRLM